MSFHNTNWETKLLSAANRVQSLLKANYTLSFGKIVLSLTCWFITDFSLYVYLAALE